MSTYKGNLIIRPICAKLTYSTETFGRMDPYCIFTLGQQKQKTRTANDADKNPNWNDTLTFQIMGDQMIHVSLFDKDTFSKDDYICEGNVSLMDVVNTGKSSQWFPLNRKGKHVGDIRIDMEFDNPSKKKNKDKQMQGQGYGYPPQQPYPYPQPGQGYGYPPQQPYPYPQQGQGYGYPQQGGYGQYGQYGQYGNYGNYGGGY